MGQADREHWYHRASSSPNCRCRSQKPEARDDEAEKTLNGARSILRISQRQEGRSGRLKRSLVRCDRNIPITVKYKLVKQIDVC